MKQTSGLSLQISQEASAGTHTQTPWSSLNPGLQTSHILGFNVHLAQPVGSLVTHMHAPVLLSTVNPDLQTEHFSSLVVQVKQLSYLGTHVHWPNDKVNPGLHYEQTFGLLTHFKQPAVSVGVQVQDPVVKLILNPGLHELQISGANVHYKQEVGSSGIQVHLPLPSNWKPG